MIVFLCICLGFIPALLCTWFIYNLDRYEPEPKWLVIGVFFWGALISTTAAILWSYSLEMIVGELTGSKKFASLLGTALLAPITEEFLKGLAVLLVFILFYQEFDSVLDGIVYASATALGFAASENALYFYFQGYVKDGPPGLGSIFFLRGVLGIWNHAAYTSFIGIGFALARLHPQSFIRFLAPIGGLLLAIFAHSLHNSALLALSNNFNLGGLTSVFLTDWFGWGVIFGIALWAAAYERKWLEIYLLEEVYLGTITQHQYDLICKQLHGLAGPWPKHHFYRLCGELALKKHQLTLKRDPSTLVILESIRRELAHLTRNSS